MPEYLPNPRLPLLHCAVSNTTFSPLPNATVTMRPSGDYLWKSQKKPSCFRLLNRLVGILQVLIYEIATIFGLLDEEAINHTEDMVLIANFTNVKSAG